MRLTKRRILHAEIKAAFGITAIIGGGAILLGDFWASVLGVTLTAVLREIETLVNWDNIDESLRFHR
jgi:hypothetical protein